MTRSASTPPPGHSAPRPAASQDGRVWFAAVAAAAPSLLAFNVSPSPTFLNQALALASWAAFFLVAPPSSPGRGPWPAWAALALIACAVAWSWAQALPSGLALSALGLLGVAALALAAGAAARREPDPAGAFAAFAWGWLIAGLLNVAVALVQVFAPSWCDGVWIAVSGLPGRAVGNLRQPNHLSSLLMWSAIALVALVAMRRVALRLAFGLLALIVLGDVLTASRTGIVTVALLALWGLLDRGLPRQARLLLGATPLLYAVWWGAMGLWSRMAQQAFGGMERIAQGDLSSSRFGIWANTLEMIRREPWTGVGFGEFNFAWTLTPFPGRPTALFDHTHNLPLQFAVEFGLPLAAAVLALLLLALWMAARQAFGRRPAPDAQPSRPAARDARAADRPRAQAGPAAPPAHPAAPDARIAERAALVFVLMIGLHSQLEYPLWYAYFLLPAAWALGYALGAARASSAEPAGGEAPAGRAFSLMNAAAVATVIGAAASVWDYQRVVVIYEAPLGAAPLARRIDAGRASVLFGHHADYAAVTSDAAPRDAAASFARTTHGLLDARLMMAWADWLALQGHADLARHLAARLREFRKEEAREYFQSCPAQPDGDAQSPYQCQRPAREPGWREYQHVDTTPR